MPPVVARPARRAAALLLAIGIGEAPVGLQGTFSVWQDNRSLTDFAHRRDRAPRRDRQRTRELGWYAEELFARFAVLDAEGRFGGGPVPGAA